MSGADLLGYLDLTAISQYGYFVIFILAAIEGPIVAIFCGAFAAAGVFNLWILFGIFILRDIIFDNLYYALGRFGGRDLLFKFEKYLKITKEKSDLLERKFLEHDWKILLLGKTQITGLPIGIILLVIAGVVKMPFWRYFWYNTLSSIPRLLILGGIGYHFGEAIVTGSKNAVNYVTIGSIVIALVLIGVFYFFQKKIMTDEGIDRDQLKWPRK